MEGEIPQQSISQSIQEGPTQNGQSAIGLKKILSFFSWLTLFSLLPLTVLILISQNSIPGDLFYPVKRGLENVILAAASVNPATKVAFRTDLTERRFNEAAKMLLAKQDVSGLSDFIQEVETTQQAVDNLSNEADKEQLTEKLVSKIDEYQNKLTQVQVQVVSPQTQISLPTITFMPTPTSIPTEIPTPTALPIQKVITTIVSAPTLIPTNTPTPLPTQTSTPTQIQVSPASNAVSPIPTASPIPSSANVGIAISDTQKRLDEIKIRLLEKHKMREGKEEKKETEERKDKDREESNGKQKEAHEKEKENLH